MEAVKGKLQGPDVEGRVYGVGHPFFIALFVIWLESHRR